LSPNSIIVTKGEREQRRGKEDGYVSVNIMGGHG